MKYQTIKISDQVYDSNMEVVLNTLILEDIEIDLSQNVI